jgi:hypothetical protein
MTDAMLLPTAVGGVYRTIKTTSFPSWLSQSASVATTGTAPVTFTQMCTDSTSLGGVFDQYRVDAVEIFLRPQANQSLITGTKPVGNLYTVLDFDDANTTISIANLEAYENCITSAVYEPQRRCFVPRLALAAYGAGAFTSYANSAPMWLDAASGSIAHFGLKAGIDVGATGALAVYDLTVRTAFSFRASR